MTWSTRRGVQVCLLLIGLLLALSFGVLPPIGRAQPSGGPDPRAVALPVEELPPGFAEDPGRTRYDERPDGGASHEVSYRKAGESDANGPSEITLSISRTIAGRESARSLTAARRSLQAAGWVEREVSLLGEEAVGFSLGAESAGGPTVAHRYLFRFGRHVLGTMVSGPAATTTSDQALGLAVRLSARLDSALAAQPLIDPDPAPAAAAPAPASAPAPVVAVAEPAPVTELAGSAAAAQPAASAATPWPAVSRPTMVGDATVADPPALGDGLTLGGLSGLVALDGSGTSFATLTDRGPNGEVELRGKKQLVFPLPSYTPRIVKLRLEASGLRVVETIPLRLPDGYTDPVTKSRELTGLPSHDAGEVPYDTTAGDRLPFDPNGVDTEGLALDPRDGSFWVADEYGPSILHVGPDGTVLARYIPRGLGLDAPGENVRELLPAALTRHKPNRGFEGIAIAPDGSRAFAIMQSPLSNPDKKAGEASRHVRLVALDTTVVGEPRLAGTYLYRAEAAAEVGSAEQDDVKIGDLAAVSATRVLVGERDSADGGTHKRIYLVDLAAATDLTDREELGGKTLEQASEADLRRLGVEAARKSTVVNLAELGYRPEKLEGLALVDPWTVAAINDNDFGIASIDERRRVTRSGVTSRLVQIRLPEPLR